MLAIFFMWFRFCIAPLCFGGDSSSASQNTTNNVDQRQSLDNGAIGATASGGGSVVMNVTQLDHGAISQSLGLASQALDNVMTMGTAAQSASAHTAEMALSGALSTINGAQQAFQQATSQVASAYGSASQQVASAYGNASQEVSTAYQDAKTGDQRTLMIGLMVVAGLAIMGPFLAKAAA